MNYEPNFIPVLCQFIMITFVKSQHENTNSKGDFVLNSLS